MKKKFVAQLALAGTIGVAAVLAAGTASAGDCSGCHTMHNSQNGVAMRFDNLASPLPVLLRAGCTACHTGLNNSTALAAGLPPKIFGGSSAPTYSGLAGGGVNGGTLAGGDFYWVTGGGGDAKGHNVVGYANADGTLTKAPGGGGTSTPQVKCAGTNGCHGNITVNDPLQSLQGAHHWKHNSLNSGTGILTSATTPGNSFRYLMGIYGGEDSNWQFTETTITHNEYVGTDRTAATAETHTISALCARCHGAYHNNAVGSSDTFGINSDNADFNSATASWTRHPTDVSVPTSDGTNPLQYSNFKTYQPETPVGRLAASLDYATAADVSSADKRIILCVSCHRAHGSPYNDALRWNYTTMLAGTSVTNGCMNCHTNK